jgi:molybdate transport system ATP-binding protein
MTDVISSNAAPGASNDRPIVLLNKVDVVLLGHTVLHNLTWELLPGEHWAVVGANGSGKTSFLKLIAGNLWPAPQRGTRRYDFGEDLQIDAVEALTKIMLVGHELQDRYTQLGWNFDATDVVLSGVFKTDIPRREPKTTERDKAINILTELNLSHLESRPFLELSRGEQRRVLIARGLAFEPRVLLLDEPVAGLDTKARHLLNEIIDQISKRITVLCSYHQTTNMPNMINRILRLDNGHVVESGVFDPSDAPHNVSTAFEISAPPESQTEKTTSKPVAIIQIKNANIWLDERHALTDITWQLIEGEHWQITGPNGAGKTTFLRMLHGQLRPAVGGSIHFPGIENPENVWTLRQQIAWVSPELQAGYWYPSTVRQCIGSGFDSSIGQTRQLAPTEAALLNDLLEQFELQDLAERNVKTLSYGQFRRVLIARAVVHKPRVLLLDEPWEGLDPENLKLVTRELNQIIAQGTQLVCATHLERNNSLFNRSMEINKGHVAFLNKISNK